MDKQKKSILVIAGGAILFLALIIFWPKLTARKPPEPINKLREEVKGVSIGRKLLNVLGESDEKTNKPLDNLINNSMTFIGNTASSVASKAQEEITKIIVEKSSEKIIEKINELPQSEKEELKKQFCQ